MIIKKYQAKTEAEAVEQAKKEMGNGVVIMNVRNLKKKGFFSMLRPQMVEITVALEEDEERSIGRRDVQQAASEAAEMPVKKNPILPRELVQSTMRNTVERTEDAKEKAIEERLDSLQNLLEKQLKPTEEEREEKKDAEEPEEKSESEAFMQLLYNTMIENEVNTNIQNAIPVVCEEMSIEEARASGAMGIFDNKYGDRVTVYTIGNISKEICGGPHAQNTKDLGYFKITKEEMMELMKSLLGK